MSKTYGFLLNYLPKPIALFLLVTWYILLILAVIDRSMLPVEDIIYLDN